jgi:hypothetical protein
MKTILCFGGIIDLGKTVFMKNSVAVIIRDRTQLHISIEFAT